MKKLLTLAFMALAAAAATAGTTYFQYSIFSPGDVMIPWERNDVRGLRLNMPFGCNKAREKNPSVGSVVGVDFGFVGVTGGNMKGLELGGFNLVDSGESVGAQFGLVANRTKDVYGLQVAGLLNWNDNLAYGAQVGALNFNSEFTGARFGLVDWTFGNMTGATLAFANVACNEFTGLSMGVFNYGLSKISGAQIGLLNVVSGASEGLQLGIVNASQHHLGVQVGLVNLNATGSIGFLPIVNVNFNR
ncbi:MAG: hypothetical protein IJ829_02020 [Kiritimatiellae bacterium]|nr:hypothetical protein [Kiritimatiellia bacterium]